MGLHYSVCGRSIAKWSVTLSAVLFAHADAQVIGPDVVVSRLGNSNNDTITEYGLTGNVGAYAMSTTACNIGDQVASWIDCTTGGPECNQHPVIAQSLYRIAEGRFEQIGVSWVKHAYCGADAVSADCGVCQSDNTCDTLGVGCADTYGAGANALQTNLGPRSEINPYTGAFPYPFVIGWNQGGGHVYKRLQVDQDHLNPSMNPGAIYVGEVQYVLVDEQPEQRFNNVSWRDVAVGGLNGENEWDLSFSGATSINEPAIEAWAAYESGVTLVPADVPGEGRFIIGYRVSPISATTWHYEYAVYNMNSDLAAGSFSAPIGNGAVVTNIGFHDVPYHSGEPYDSADWTTGNDGGALTWSTQSFGMNPNANALRWGTVYNFRFDADTPPQPVNATIGLFKSGASLTAAIVGPSPGELPRVCGNSIIEFGEDCDPPNGTTCDNECHRIPTCGDGVQDPGEQCDDSNTTPGDGCSATCQIESNDHCPYALPIGDGTIAFDTTLATTDGPVHGGGDCQFDGQTYNDIWYNYTASCTGDLTVSLCGSNYDTDLVIYTGCTCNLSSANMLGCNDDGCPGSPPASYRSELPSSQYPDIPVTEGGCYRIRVGGFDANSRGTGTMTITNSASPCFVDCNGNTVNDPLDIANGTSQDCNHNDVPDECDLASGAPDCNDNDVPDECDLTSGAADCNANDVPDSCDIAGGVSTDCNENGVPDECVPDGGAVAGDLDQDCDVDLDDFVIFHQCLTDAGGGPPENTCVASDLDGDGDVDLGDWGRFQILFSQDH